MKHKINKDSMKYKIAVLVVYSLVIIGLSIACIPLAKVLLSDGGMAKLEQILRQYEHFSIVIFVLIQAIQVPIAILPPVQIVGGMLFGSVFGSILSVVGLWLGSAFVFWVVKKAGVPLVEAIINKKHRKRFKFLEDGEKVTFVLFVLYLIPGTPKDALTYFVPLTKIDLKTFLCVVLPARIPAIVISALFGSSISKENHVLTVIISVIIVLSAVFGFVFRDKLVDKIKKIVVRKKNG